MIPSLVTSIIFAFSGIVSLMFLAPQHYSPRALRNFYRPLNTMDGMEQESSNISIGNADCDILLIENNKTDQVNTIDLNQLTSSNGEENIDYIDEIFPNMAAECRNDIVEDERSDSCHTVLSDISMNKSSPVIVNKRKRVLFNTSVTVKTIGSIFIEVNELRHIHEGEEPIHIVSPSTNIACKPMNVASHSKKEAHTINRSSFAYDNGSHIYLSRRGTMDNKRILKLISTSKVFLCVLINGLIGFSVLFSLDLFSMELMDSPYFSSNNPLFASYVCSANFIAILFTIYWYTSKARHSGTLYLFYIFSQIYALSSLFIIFVPLSLPYMPNGTYYAILWILLVILASSSSMLILLVFIFTYNSCYSHERLIVMRWNMSAFLLGSVLGSYLASTSFVFSKWFRDLYDIQIRICWLLPVIIVKLLLTLIGKLPKKIQRVMREPTEPRYTRLHISEVEKF